MGSKNTETITRGEARTFGNELVQLSFSAPHASKVTLAGMSLSTTVQILLDGFQTEYHNAMILFFPHMYSLHWREKKKKAS